MIDLAQINSRMKDFYDVYRLLAGEQCTDLTLTEAVRQTFGWRQTAVRSNHPLFSHSFAADARRLGQWQAFLRKSSLDDSLAFAEVMRQITDKMLPIYQLLVEEAQGRGRA